MINWTNLWHFVKGLFLIPDLAKTRLRDLIECATKWNCSWLTGTTAENAVEMDTVCSAKTNLLLQIFLTVILSINTTFKRILEAVDFVVANFISVLLS